MVFIREIVPKRMVALVARVVYNENYLALPMRSSIEMPAGADKPGIARYEWRMVRTWNGIFVTWQGSPEVPPAGSEEEFITEHYWGYTKQRDGSTIEYGVEHPRWSLACPDDGPRGRGCFDVRAGIRGNLGRTAEVGVYHGGVAGGSEEG